MFERTIDSFYKSLGRSIKRRKEALGLRRKDILNDEARVSKIVNGWHKEPHRYLIGRDEYPYLNYLFLCKDHKSFIENNQSTDPKERAAKNGKNYDEMLWGHIDWDEMFRNAITELSEVDISEDIGKLFEDTLIDYVPYAVIRYDELCPEYARISIFSDERKETRQKAIERVHFGRGKEIFRNTFEKHFYGKTLFKFDDEFDDFISDYLKKIEPNVDSLGLQAYNFYKNLSKFVADWQSLPEVQYAEENDEKSDLKRLLEEYIKDGREHMQKLLKYQQKFDNLHIDMK